MYPLFVHNIAALPSQLVNPTTQYLHDTNNPSAVRPTQEEEYEDTKLQPPPEESSFEKPQAEDPYKEFPFRKPNLRQHFAIADQLEKEFRESCRGQRLQAEREREEAEIGAALDALLHNELQEMDFGAEEREKSVRSPRENNARLDYQIQLMLLEQQNKKRLLLIREERLVEEHNRAMRHCRPTGPVEQTELAHFLSRDAPQDRETQLRRRREQQIRQLQMSRQEQSNAKHLDETEKMLGDLNLDPMDWEEISASDAESQNTTPRMTPPESLADFQMEDNDTAGISGETHF